MDTLSSWTKFKGLLSYTITYTMIYTAYSIVTSYPKIRISDGTD